MRFLLLGLFTLGCSNSLTAELITRRAEPSGQVRVELLNDSAVDATWSPCDQVWFIETANGRERDAKRVYCSLDHTIPFGSSEITLIAPEREGTFFVELRVIRQMTFVTLEVGPIEIAK